MELQCDFQNYEWGKLGLESEVARLVSVCNKLAVVEPNKPYAELWMGTHVNAPSRVVDTDESLSVWLRRNLDSLGTEVRKEFGDDLPFLFKVLSVRKALSVQAHPNKEHAERLHADFPNIYKDPNHKPELAIALTPFQALCGFRNINDIKKFISEIPELQHILGDLITKRIIESDDSSAIDCLKEAFQQLMLCDSAIVNENLTKFISRLNDEDTSKKDVFMFSLLSRLANEYPGDRGCWCIYFMNYINMKPGEAIFLGPNIPHAYLYGDCIECMACSDNVVRAGLTPKLIDVPTLINMLVYESKPIDQLLFQPEVEDKFTQTWRPPVKDFAVCQIKIPSNHKEEYNTILRPSASILVIIAGRAIVKDSLEKRVERGTVLYLKANRQLTILQDSDSELILYQAMCNFK